MRAAPRSAPTLFDLAPPAPITIPTTAPAKPRPLTDEERWLMRVTRRRFDDFVQRLNRRDSYQLERDDATRPVSAERRAVLDERLTMLQDQIADDERKLTRMAQRLADLEIP
jgi:hypothetical protein